MSQLPKPETKALGAHIPISCEVGDPEGCVFALYQGTTLVVPLEFLHFLVRSVSRFEKKTSWVLSFCFVSGHDFSRAITDLKRFWL
jgi:hypothetical protein